MKLPHKRLTLTLSVTLLVIGLSLAGCTSTPVADTATPTDTATGTSSPTSTAEASAAARPWDECPGLVERLNAEEDVPVVYAQIPASEFPTQGVGVDVLAVACVMSVTTTEPKTTFWAILPGGDPIVETVKANLADDGFLGGPGLVELMGKESTNEGIQVSAFENGAALDDYLFYPKAFAPISEKIVFIGAFNLD